MVEKKAIVIKVFLLNEENKILIFSTLNNKIPKIIVPALINMTMLRSHLSQNLNEYEYITSYTTKMERLKAVNGHLEKHCLITTNRYYAKTFELTEEMRNSINRFCEENFFSPYFLSIEEIEETFKYIKENYKDVRPQTDLEQSLYVLKRKLNYEEY